jgi:hypothetical protein
LTNLAPEFDIQNFDISPDGREVVIERVQERSNVVLMDLHCATPATKTGAHLGSRLISHQKEIGPSETLR